MDHPLRLHVYGRPEAATDRATRVLQASPSLSETEIEALRSQVYYGFPEISLATPPVAWAIQRLPENLVALSRTWTTAADGSAALYARSIIFDLGTYSREPYRLMDLATDTTFFPVPEPTSPRNGQTEWPWPPSRPRAAEILGMVVQLVRSDRRALNTLLRAMLAVAEQRSPIRSVILALPIEAFTRDLDILQTFVGLLTLLPRTLRRDFSFVTYQDAVAPRPLTGMAIPTEHRCINRLVRSPGYYVFPDDLATAPVLSSVRLEEYAALAVGLLLDGRFEEAAALAETFLSHGTALMAEAREDSERQTQLRRLVADPQPDDFAQWLEHHALPPNAEERLQAVSVLAVLIEREIDHLRFSPAARLLRATGSRWPELAWDDPELAPLSPTLIRLLETWQTEQGWDPVCAMFGRLVGSGWARAMATRALCAVLARRNEPPGIGRIDPALAQIEMQLDGQSDVRPPVCFLLWLVRHCSAEDPRVARYLSRGLSAREPEPIFFRFFSGLGDPADAGFRSLFKDLVRPLSRSHPQATEELLTRLFTLYDFRTPAGRSLFRDVVEHLCSSGQQEILVKLLDRAVSSAGDASGMPLETADLARIARTVDLPHWEQWESQLLRQPSADLRQTITLRAVWTLRYRHGEDVGTQAYLGRIERLHRTLPQLTLLDLQTHQALLDVAGPGASVNLTLGDMAMLEETQGDRAVEQYLALCLDLLARQSPWVQGEWQQTLLERLHDGQHRAEQSRRLWRLWSVARHVGQHDLSRRAFRWLIRQGLMAELDEGALEMLCRLLPGDIAMSRFRVIIAALEAALYQWSATGGGFDDVLRLMRAQADALRAAEYAELVERAFSVLFARPTEPAESELRTFLDGIYAPRHSDALADRLAALSHLRPSLRAPLNRLRRSGGFKRFPSAVLSFLDGPATAPLRSHREM